MVCNRGSCACAGKSSTEGARSRRCRIGCRGGAAQNAAVNRAGDSLQPTAAGRLSVLPAYPARKTPFRLNVELELQAALLAVIRLCACHMNCFLTVLMFLCRQLSSMNASWRS